jgi:tRNA 2-selenouridine synthase
MSRLLDIHTYYQTYSQSHLLIDARSPAEYEKGCIPGAVNIPLLSNEHRHEVGICYKQKGKEEAISLGFQLAGPHFHEMIAQAREQSSGLPLLVYCWRGGLRSRILSWILETAGMSCTLVEGGYKTFRNLVLQTFEKNYQVVVLGGKTGMGKTQMLHALSRHASVIDLEALAHHRGSAFGNLGMPAQPSQEMFENKLALALLQIPPGALIWFENESRMIGKRNIPDPLFDQIMQAPIIQLEHDDDYRIEGILREYGHFPKEALAEKTRNLEKRLGNEKMNLALQALSENRMYDWVALLLSYYDKTYTHGYYKRPEHLRLPLDIRNLDSDQILSELQDMAQSFFIKA